MKTRLRLRATFVPFVSLVPIVVGGAALEPLWILGLDGRRGIAARHHLWGHRRRRLESDPKPRDLE